MSSFVEKLKRLLPEALIIADEELLRVYECDGLSAYRQLPRCVVLPENVNQVQAIMRLCHDEEVPVVARGAGTGLSGGAMPVADGLVLGLAKFNQIIHLDPSQRIARVQPGVRNISVSEAAAEYGLFYAPDPSSQIICTIGGNVAENSGGIHCLKYGLTVHNILAIKLITVTGELLEIGGDALDSAGYDLLALMTGSEGMLGVIVEVTLKLLSQPLNNRVLLAAFDEIEEAGRGVADIIASGIIPAGLEMMDNGGIRAVEDYLHAGYPVDAAAILICEVDGAEEEVDEECRKVEAILKVAGASNVRIARNKEEGDKFWEGRKSAFPAVGRIAADYYCMDGTIPRKHIASVLHRIDELAQQYKLGVVNVFHAGDGNLHPLIMYDVSIEGELERAEELGGKILEVCVEVGGTITGEHGVGIEKINQMCVQFNTEELVQFHAIKNAFDPKGLLNPGKAIPTLNRCAEFGAMHIHRGQLAHPELERF
ncbi:MAG: FAD-binding protein [Gammaproteobacteria bacterium]|nr:FAD-binding protein [Gammaproteobacteria bacterium]MCK5498676.1 FAD-binding protein [Gammaproteobacteria bacterium]